MNTYRVIEIRDPMAMLIAGLTLAASAALVVLIILGLPSRSEAYLVHEIHPGVLELRGSQDGNLIVENIHVDRRHRWTYLEVREARPLAGIAAVLRNQAQSDRTHYFYLPFKRGSFKVHQHLRLLQYGIMPRVQNARGKVPFGQKRFFYPLVLFKSVS